MARLARVRAGIVTSPRLACIWFNGTNVWTPAVDGTK